MDYLFGQGKADVEKFLRTGNFDHVFGDDRKKFLQWIDDHHLSNPQIVDLIEKSNKESAAILKWNQENITR